MTAQIDRRVLAFVAALAAICLGFGFFAGLYPLYAITAAIGIAFMGMVLANITVGLCLLVVLSFVDVGASQVTKLVGLVLALSWLAMIATRRDLPGTVFSDRPVLAYALVLLAGWSVISLLWAEDLDVGATAITRYVPNLLIIPITYSAVSTKRQTVWVLATIVAAGALAAVVGLAAPPTASGLAVGDSARSTGTVGDANEFAAGLVVAAVLAGAFALNRRYSIPARAAGGCVVVLCVFGVFTSLSRGGLVALGVATLVAVLAAGRWRLRVVAVACVLIGSVGLYFTAFAPLPARERVTNIGGGTGRLDLWTVGARMVESEPLLGVGVGNFPVASIHYLLRPGAIERAEFIITTPKVAHNTYLQFFAELGVLGGTLFLGIVLFSITCALRAAHIFRGTQDEQMEILMRGLVVALAGYLTAIVFISANYSKLMWILLALGPATLAVAGRSEMDARVAPPQNSCDTY
jgi:O-antigen ligase